MEIIKKCTKCGLEKPLDEFVKDNRRKDGHSTICKECKRAYDRERYAKIKNNPDFHKKKLEHGAKYRAAHKDEIRKYSEEYNMRPEVIERKSEWYYKKVISRSISEILQDMISRAKYRAEEKSIPFSITKEDLVYTEICPLLEIPLNWKGGPRDNDTPSLDRIIPQLGYIPGNVRIISNLANMMKNSANFSQLITFAKNINNYLENKDIVQSIEKSKESIELEDKEPLS